MNIKINIMSNENIKDEVSLKEMRIMSEISRIISKDNGNTTHPVWDEDEDGKMTLHLFTYNDRNNQTFLLKSTKGNSKAGALTKALNYLNQELGEENSYTVIWRSKDRKKQEESYFSGKDVWEVLEKFYFGKEREDIIIFEIKLSPIS